MARFVVPVAVLVALVGAYVVGQQADVKPAPAAQDQLEPLKGEPGELVEDGLQPESNRRERLIVEGHDPNVLHYEMLADLPGDANRDGKVDLSDFGILKDHFISGTRRAYPIGRYVPAEGGRMLDTTNGTLYAVSGAAWQVVARLNANETAPSANNQATPPGELVELAGCLRRPVKWTPQLELVPAGQIKHIDVEGEALRNIAEGTPLRLRGIVRSRLHQGGTANNPSPFPPQWIVWLEVTEILPGLDAPISRDQR